MSTYVHTGQSVCDRSPHAMRFLLIYLYNICATTQTTPPWCLSSFDFAAERKILTSCRVRFSVIIEDKWYSFKLYSAETDYCSSARCECWVNCVQSRQVVATLPSHQNYHHDNPSILNTVCSGCGSCIQNSVLHMYVAYIHRCILRTIKIIVATTYRF
jgi:hypothetical protein